MRTPYDKKQLKITLLVLGAVVGIFATLSVGGAWLVNRAFEGVAENI